MNIEGKKSFHELWEVSLVSIYKKKGFLYLFKNII